jgi:hypothetical protein
MFELIELYEEEFRDPKIREEYEEYLDRLADEFDYDTAKAVEHTTQSTTYKIG